MEGLIFGILRYKNNFQQKHGTRHIATWKLYAINFLHKVDVPGPLLLARPQSSLSISLVAQGV